MNRFRLVAIALFAVPAPLLAQQHSHSPQMNHDSAFAAVQRRGALVMGVDQYTSKHVFEPLADGGRIELLREVEDSAGAAQIRSHLADVAGQFARGEFSAPFLVHATEVPGTRVMAEQRSAIRYEVRALARGGEIRIRTDNRAALAAIHEFLAFQRSDHRAH